MEKINENNTLKYENLEIIESTDLEKDSGIIRDNSISMVR